MTITWQETPSGNKWVVLQNNQQLNTLKTQQGWTDADVLARLDDTNNNGKIDIGERIYMDTLEWRNERDDEYKAAKEDPLLTEEKVVGGVLGGAAGGLAAAAIGAKMGGTAGSALGPAGVVVGVLIGACIGWIIGDVCS